jgi:hypothetical protein
MVVNIVRRLGRNMRQPERKTLSTRRGIAKSSGKPDRQNGHKKRGEPLPFLLSNQITTCKDLVRT